MKWTVLCVVLSAFGGCKNSTDTDGSDTDDSESVLKGAEADEVTSIGYYGDIWVNAWGIDGTLYMAFGDGTGISECVPLTQNGVPGTWDPWTVTEASPGCFEVADDGTGMQEMFCQVFDCSECYPLCPFTPFGMVGLEGNVPNLDPCVGESCFLSRHIPVGDESTFTRADKPSGLIALEGFLIMAAHRPDSEPIEGYLAVSDNGGLTWSEIENSPWTKKSHFRVLMFIQTGKNCALAQDSHAYALAVGDEFPSDLAVQDVYLTRVPYDSLVDYGSYEYFSGTADSPDWSSNEDDAKALDGLATIAQAGALYHEGLDRYFFLSGLNDPSSLDGAVYEAPQPWGPWTRVTTIDGPFISNVLAKGAGDDFFYFTKAGGMANYNLNIGRVDFWE